MTGSSEAVETPRRWNDALRTGALQVVAEGVTEFAGFEVASIVVVRGHEVECVAVAGDPEATARILGVRAPVSILLDLLPLAEDWGMLRFVPHERLTPEAEEHGLLPEGWDDSDTDAAAWHSRDGLFAPLYDQEGHLRGALSVDRPRDRRRPGPSQREILERYAVQALRAILSVLEHEDLAHRMRMAETARQVVRTATTRTSLAEVMAGSRAALLEGYAARETWIQVFDSALLDEESPGVVGGRAEESVLVEATSRFAGEGWLRQQVVRVRPEHALGIELDPDDQALVRGFLTERGIGSMMLVPLGAGEECLGALLLTRSTKDPEWSELEASMALDLGHDLGRALLNLRTVAQQQLLVDRLRAVDHYKDELISTVSHELRTPLTSILGNLELLEMEDLTSAESHSALGAVGRGARRLVATVEDLLLLSRMGDPDAEHHLDLVDLRDVVNGVRDLIASSARSTGHRVDVTLPEDPVLARADAEQLDRAVANLVTNALKYSPQGSVVSLGVEVGGHEVAVCCTDRGFGISSADQESVFREFFRSESPDVRSRPGTGLGLAIVDRIARRHAGRIEVESTLGEGSTFRLCLPGVGS